MRNILVQILILFPLVFFAQKHDVTVNNTVTGIILRDSSEIRATEYVFPEKIYNTYLDSASGLITLQLRDTRKNGKYLKNKGHIYVYDLNNKKVKWNDKINYGTSSLKQFGDILLLRSASRSYLTDINTGEKLGELNAVLYYIDPVARTGMGYKRNVNSGFSDKFRGINIDTGKFLWERNISRKYGWNDALKLNDSILLIVAEGLHSVNIKNGKGWDYNTVTGKKDYTGVVAANVAGAALGILTGTYFISSGPDVITELVSNVFIDSSYIYFSSAEQLAKVDIKSGKTAWIYPFRKKLAGKSVVFCDEDKVYMINKAYGFTGYRKQPYGKPFIAAFDKKNGKEYYFSTIGEKNNPINDVFVENGEICLIFKDRAARYSQTTGSLISEKVFDNGELGMLNFFIGKQVFVKNNYGEYVSLSETDSSNVYIFTTEGKILSVDKFFNISEVRDIDDLYVLYLKKENFGFIANKSSTYIINEKGEKIAELNADSDSFISGNIFYSIFNKSIFTVDLSKILTSGFK